MNGRLGGRWPPPTFHSRGPYPRRAPVLGSRNRRDACARRENAKSPVSGLASASNDWSPSRPSRQLSSTKRVIEVWSVVAWLTELRRAYGEIASRGVRGP